MKKMKLLVSIFVSFFILAQYAHSQGISLPPSGGNQKAEVSQWMGPVEVTINYSSPDVTAPNGESRKGKIWGELVPYGLNNLGFGTSTAAPWRAGANENTTFSISHDVTIGGKTLAAGTYGLHMIVNEGDEWTIIFSNNSSSWGSYFYNEAEDVLRVQAKVEEAPFTEYLTYGFDDRKLESSTAFLQWENKKVSFPIEVENVKEYYLSSIRDELRSSPGFNYMSLVQASNFCIQNEINLEEALTWADNAIAAPFIGRENFMTLQTKAMVLDKLGKNEEANVVMESAINHPTASITDIHSYGRTLISQGKTAKALEAFMLNKKKHPEDNFTTNIGLARGYQAVGDTKKAIKHWEVAIENIPENQKANLPYYQNEVKKLKEGDNAGK